MTYYYQYGLFAGEYNKFFYNKDRCGMGRLNSDAIMPVFFGLNRPYILVFDGFSIAWKRLGVLYFTGLFYDING
jgi:hypothetical protein